MQQRQPGQAAGGKEEEGGNDQRENLEKAKEDHVEVSYYWEMYHSEVYWKGMVCIVQKMLGWLKLESAKLEALKENIRMHVIGLGWKQFTITWSYRGAMQLVEELAAHLRVMIREEKKLTPPKDPAFEMPKRLELPILGTAIQQLMESNATARINEEQFKKEVENCKNRGRQGTKEAFFCHATTLLSGAG